MDLDAIVSQLQRAVPDLIAAYRFGSSVSGQVHRDSDLDLALLARARLDPLERWKLQEELARAAGRDVDLVDLRAASAVLRKEVIASGEVLLDVDPGERARFEAFVLGAYARLNDERKHIIEDVRRRGSVRG